MTPHAHVDHLRKLSIEMWIGENYSVGILLWFVEKTLTVWGNCEKDLGRFPINHSINITVPMAESG